jgi:chemotaxis protein CheC
MKQYFSADESDAFTEIFNIGAGKAANALSELLDTPIEFTVPFCVVLPVEHAAEFLRERFGTNVSIISQDFSGPFDGSALLMFQETSSLKLAQCVLGGDEPVESLSELEREALTEIGNIVLNACLSSFGDLLHREVATSLPRFNAGDMAEILNETSGYDLVLIVKVDFKVRGGDIEGYVTFVLNVDSVNAFREAAGQLMSSLH